MFNIGDRVLDRDRGAGEVVERDRDQVLVLFDEALPGLAYHRGVEDNFPDRCWYLNISYLEPDYLTWEND